MIPFHVQKRDLTFKPHQLRKKNLLPGIIYGGDKNISIQVPLNSFKDILHRAGRSHIINLSMEGYSALALLKDFQLHPLSDHFIHFDLLEVDQTREVRVRIPVKITGNAKGLKEGGLLEILQESVEVVCKVKDIPSEFEVDVTPLEIGFSIHLSALSCPEGVRFTQDSHTVIVVVTGEAVSSEEDSPSN